MKSPTLLLFSKNEKLVFEALRAGITTPLRIAQKVHIPRPTVYITLSSLQERGLIHRRTENGHHYWTLSTSEEIEDHVYEMKKYLFDFKEGQEEIRTKGDSFINVYRGEAAIAHLAKRMFASHKKEVMYGLQGSLSTEAWSKLLSVEKINKMNRDIKDNKVVVHAFLEEGWVHFATKTFGVDWIKDFEGRTTGVHEVPSKYLQHATEVWLFKEELYLLAPKEEVVIEIKNSDMVKMMKSLLNFVEDNTLSIDINKEIRSKKS